MAEGHVRPFEVVLFGATGYTGKLCAEYIHSQLPSDLRWAIAGRSRDKLESLLTALSAKDRSRTLPAIEVCDLKAEQVHRLAQKSQVIISTVGPYESYGEPIFQACAESGTHYVDCTGETPWIHSMIAKYQAQAQISGAIMVPSCGFDSVPSDISALAVVNFIRTNLKAHTARVDCSMHEIRGSFSGGSMGSIISAFDKYAISELFGMLTPLSLSPRQPKRNQPRLLRSFASRSFGLRHIPELGWMGVHPQGFVDQCYVYRSWGLAADSETEAYGENFEFRAWIRMPGVVSAFFWHIGMLTALGLFMLPPTRWLVQRIWFKPGDGPTERFREQSSFELLTTAASDTKPPQQILGRFKFQGDPYVFTAICLGEAALLLSRESSVRNSLQGGVVTTARFGSLFIERLREKKAKISVELI